jgi:hypothetical protein
MTGLDLVTFLRLLRVDVGLWLSFAAILVVLGLMAWTTWGSRRVLRKCLLVSILVHLGLIAVGGQTTWALRAFGPPQSQRVERERIESIRVTPEESRVGDGGAGAGGGASSLAGLIAPTRPLAPWDLPGASPRETASAILPLRPEAPEPAAPLERGSVPLAPVQPEAGSPAIEPPTVAAPDNRLVTVPEPGPAGPGGEPAEADPSDLPEVATAPRPSAPPEPLSPLRAGERSALVRPPRASSPVVARPSPEAASGAPGIEPDVMVALPTVRGRSPAEARAVSPVPDTPSRPEPSGGPADETAATLPAPAPRAPTIPAPTLAVPGAEGRLKPRMPDRSALLRPYRPPENESIAFASPTDALSLPDFARGPAPSRALPDVPAVYRSRLEPNRSQRAQRAGASPESEAAVERALVWLARHQDADGRWDAATGRDASGAAARGEDDYTIHCPPGDICYGECHYWEADTALTGLSLLAYLGAGCTHKDGKAHAGTVAKGLDYLRSVQLPDGDLRGSSRAVGMYCHAMAALALCEAYALTGDAELRIPAERAVDFLVRARAADGMSWRYAPGAPSGDTSILGWVILVLKSAREVGLPVSGDVQDGAARWLQRVSRGEDGGLAAYRPGEPVTPTMTAEAWVCRQFLGLGARDQAGAEASTYLLAHGPGEDPYNIYYWYYGTLSMFQHGGDAWARWNKPIRDELVRRQKSTGHQDGSWDPDDSQYGRFGGRIYTTALATLTLEVYYRYLRLQEQPGRRTQPEQAKTAPVRRADAARKPGRR